MNLGRGFQWLMVLNAALTFAATVLLTISPDTIPATVGFPPPGTPIRWDTCWARRNWG
jgi:hypothetical protein